MIVVNILYHVLNLLNKIFFTNSDVVPIVFPFSIPIIVICRVCSSSVSTFVIHLSMNKVVCCVVFFQFS